MAGIMNVRADRSIQWPEKQEIGDLQLNFVRLAPKAHPIKRAIISTTPLFVGLLAIWIIAVNVFQLEAVITTAGTGQLEDVAKAIGVLTSAPDFWLWFYISFTIANTMFPSIPKDMRGWWQVSGAIVVVVAVLVILGIGQGFLTEITLSITQLLNTLSLTLILTLFINLMMVMGLGLIEYTTERITGHSATFQKGKMITMTRQEAIALKQEEQQKRLASRAASAQRRRAAPDLTSVYALELPIPGPPSQEPITKGVAAIMGMEDDEPRPSITETEDDEIIETTAKDSERQRRLRLFPETSEDTDDTVQQDERLLPKTSEQKPARPKPAFDIQSFASPKQDSPEVDNDEKDTDELVVTTKPVEETDTISEVETRSKSETSDTEISTVASVVESKATEQSTKKQPIPEEVKKDDTDNDEQLTSVAPPTSNWRSQLTTATDKDQEDTDNDEQLTSVTSSTSNWRSPVTTTPSDEETIDIKNADDEIDDNEELISVASTTTDWRNQLSSKLTKTNTDSDANDDETKSSESFSRPFARPFQDDDEDADLNIVDSEDTENNIITSAEFARPFVPRDSVEDDEDDEDEQLSTRFPQAINPFDTSGKTSPTSSWRDKLSDIDSDDEDDEDEPLTPPSAKPKARTTSDWRSQLAQTDTNEDEDNEDNEQLTNHTRPRSNIFESLKTAQGNKPTSSWRDKLSDIDSENEDEDDEDEPLTPASAKPNTRTTSDWRSQLTQTDTNEDEDNEDDEQLTNRTRPRSNIFESLNTAQGNKPTPNWRDKLSDIDSENEDEDDEQLTAASAKSKAHPTSDWRSQLSQTDNEEEDEDDEQLSNRTRPRSNIFESLNTAQGNKPASSWRDKLSNVDSGSDDTDDDDEQLAGSGSILSGLGRTKPDKPRSNIVGSGSRPAPKPSTKKPKTTTSDWRNQLSGLDTDESDDDIVYEPLDDEVIYEDEDDIYYEDDDDMYYDDD